jgi:hypothetical protein
MHLMELAKELTPAENHSGYDEKLATYATLKQEIQRSARALEAQVEAADAKSAALREPRQNLFLALTLFQIVDQCSLCVGANSPSLAICVRSIGSAEWACPSGYRP